MFSLGKIHLRQNGIPQGNAFGWNPHIPALATPLSERDPSFCKQYSSCQFYCFKIISYVRYKGISGGFILSRCSREGDLFLLRAGFGLVGCFFILSSSCREVVPLLGSLREWNMAAFVSQFQQRARGWRYCRYYRCWGELSKVELIVATTKQD